MGERRLRGKELNGGGGEERKADGMGRGKSLGAELGGREEPRKVGRQSDGEGAGW